MFAHSSQSTSALALRPEGLSWRSRLIAGLVMVFIFVGAIFAFSAQSASAAECKEDDQQCQALKSLSFYKAASSMTSFWSTVQSPPGDKTANEKGAGSGFTDEWKADLGTAGSAGSLMGYLDPKFSFSPDWLAAKFSGSSDAIGYDTLTTSHGIYSYALYGAALSGMGLDHTGTGLSLGFVEFIAGGFMQFLYILAGLQETLFLFAIAVLKFLNPFRLLYDGVAAINTTFANGMVGGSNAAPSVDGFDSGVSNGIDTALTGVRTFIRDWYVTLSSISWAVILPIFLGVLILGMLLFKNMDKGSAIKRFIIRAVFITLGVPLLGSMYTATLNAYGSDTDTTTAGSTRVIMSTFVDFEGWMRSSRLAVPSAATIQWDANKNEPTALAQMNARRSALAINTQTHHLPTTVTMLDENTLSTSWSNSVFQGDDRTTNVMVYLRTMSMLGRYMNKSMVPASSIESEMKATMSANEARTRGWFQQIIVDNPKVINERQPGAALTSGDSTVDPPAFSENPVIFVQRGQGLQMRSLSHDGDAAYRMDFSTRQDGCIATPLDPDAAIRVGTSPRACNLAPLAVYNYLNTDFGPTSMVMYSSSNVQSEATRSVHMAVNLVGAGPMPALYWFSAVFLLLSFIVIGFVYGIGMIFGSIRRTIQGMVAIPFSLLGSLSGIVKVIVYFTALILQILVTVFAYKFIQEFLISLPQIIEMPFAASLSGLDTGVSTGFLAFLLTGTGLGIGVSIITIIAFISFTVMAIRLRKTLLAAIEETVEKIVSKFVEAKPGMPKAGGSMLGAAAAGAAGGIGMAAAGAMLHRSSGASNVAVGNGGPTTPNASGTSPTPPTGGGSHPGNGMSPAGGGGGGTGGSGGGGGNAGGSAGPVGGGGMPSAALDREGPRSPALQPNPSAGEKKGRALEGGKNVMNTTIAGAKAGVPGALIGAGVGVAVEAGKAHERRQNETRSSLDGPPKQRMEVVGGAVQQIGNIYAMKGGAASAATAGGSATPMPQKPQAAPAAGRPTPPVVSPKA